MLGDDSHKEILVEDYRRNRELAEKARDRGNYNQASNLYYQCARLLEDIEDLESSTDIAEEVGDLAENLREAAQKLEHAESDSPQRPTQSQGNSEANQTDVSGSPDVESDVSDAESYLEEPPDMDFDDVGGMGELKQSLIDRVVDPLDRPELYEEYNLGVVNGVLLYGPPGTGKTYLTRALAGKLDYNFISVTPTDITSSLVGEAADNVADLFRIARQNQPCLVFIDEIDAIASARSGGAQKTQSERQMVNQLLTELTEIQGEDVIVVGATNMLDEVDDAIKRSGRFDERIEVPPPDAQARIAILRVHLRGRPVLTEELDWDRIREVTGGYSASDLELIATNAARKALADARDSGDLRQITQEYIDDAIEETDSSLEEWDAPTA
jgi:transitional endoplasmic reticulum ATPase